ncbi:MAG: hypothetical protein K6A64_10375 [Bacteroidales bacterium]|nr:hypothetical protein [Bacteroidales bacterium]
MILDDKNIRDILLAGEETVSPQVWAGVAKGLDKAAVATRRRVVVLWSSVVSLAAAAAVAAVVVFTPANKPQSPAVTPVVAVVETSAEEEAPVVNEVEEIEAVTAPEETIAAQVARSGLAVSAVAQNNIVAEEASVSEPVVAEPVSEESPVSEPLVSVPTEPEASGKQDTAEPTAAPAPSAGSIDPFALLLAEQNRVGNKPTAITFSGLAQAGRVRQSSSVGPGRISAPSAPVTGIKESGDNRFELPVSFGIGLRFPVVANLSIGAGLNYTRLARSFTGTYTEAEEGVVLRRISDVTISETQQYIGLPVNIYYDFVSNSRFTASAFVGATVERCLAIDYRIPDSGNTVNYSREPKSLQPSVAAGIGLQYNFLPRFSLYAEPGVRYYFDAHQAPSIRTMQPWMVSLELGLRYNLGK